MAKYTTTVNGIEYNTRKELERDYCLNGAVIWQGPSRIDGKEIVLIATGLGRSKNTKTGDVVQTYILLVDEHPYEAIKRGTDCSVCGDCPHRCKVQGDTSKASRTCYVRGDSIGTVWRTFAAGRYMPYTRHPLARKAATENKTLRLGAYGDPAAVPVEIWRALLDDNRYAAHTGYTHQWRNECGQEYKGLVQASCDNSQDVVDAVHSGWHVFAVKFDDSQTDAEFWQAVGEGIKGKHCPASKESGRKATCASCKMCNGSRHNVVINVH